MLRLPSPGIMRCFDRPRGKALKLTYKINNTFIICVPLKSGKWANELPRQMTASKPSPGFWMSSDKVSQLASSITEDKKEKSRTWGHLRKCRYPPQTCALCISLRQMNNSECCPHTGLYWEQPRHDGQCKTNTTQSLFYYYKEVRD